MKHPNPTNAGTPRLKVERLSKSFADVPVLKGVGFEAWAGEVLAVVGENGSGKSTTMNVLSGVLARDSGQVWLDGELFSPKSRRESDAAGIAFIQQELNVFPNLSVADNIFLLHAPKAVSGLPFISRKSLHEEALHLLNLVGLNVSPGTPASALSTGERQMVEIARALSTDARVLILDEPTSSLTSVEAARLFEILGRMKAKGVAILYISHNLEEVLSLADKVLVMRDGAVTRSGAARASTVEDLVLAMVGQPIDDLYPKRAQVSQPPRAILETKGLSQPGQFKEINLVVGRGEIVGIAGVMGSGRSEVARAIFGLDPHRQGSIWVSGEAVRSGDLKARLDLDMAFVTEDRRHEALLMDASVEANAELAVLPRFSARRGAPIRRRALDEQILEMAKRVRLKSGSLRKTLARSLSGGNQQKLVFGRWLLREPKVLLMDEPTRGVDIKAKQEIYRLLVTLAAQGAAILIISSEIEELLGLCDRIHVMRQGAFIAHFRRDEATREGILRACLGVGAAA